jgi:mannose-6-phosphate isomerase-like protein (cupin superfamily)
MSDMWCAPTAKIVEKGWGKEEWICNNEKYCSKRLILNQGKKCSYHFHLLKDETFFVSEGQILLRYGYDVDINKAESLILNVGESFHIPPGLIHQFEGIVDSMIIETSTTHYETDSYRIVKGN